MLRNILTVRFALVLAAIVGLAILAAGAPWGPT
jgi:hypothetical protein